MPSQFRNTGEQEIEQIDTNPTSPTYGTRRWVVSGVNTTACPIPPPASTNFRSALIARLVYRDNCPAGSFPDGVTYRLEEGFRTSVISQIDADNQAEAYFAANSQAFANANDTCTGSQAEQFTCEIDVNDCWTGWITFADGRHEPYSTQDQYQACYVASSSNPTPGQNVCPSV